VLAQTEGWTSHRAPPKSGSNEGFRRVSDKYDPGTRCRARPVGWRSGLEDRGQRLPVHLLGDQPEQHGVVPTVFGTSNDFHCKCATAPRHYMPEPRTVRQRRLTPCIRNEARRNGPFATSCAQPVDHFNWQREVGQAAPAPARSTCGRSSYYFLFALGRPRNAVSARRIDCALLEYVGSSGPTRPRAGRPL
jgi:hypothetical protein